MAWIGPLHFGNFGGFGIRFVWLVAGLAPGVLAVTGLILWWTRVVAPRWRRRDLPSAAVQPEVAVVPLPDDVST